MRCLLIIVCLLVGLGCSDPEKVPKDILPRKKMEKVLWDMMLADRYASQFLVRDSLKINVKEETFRLYDQVFQVNQINKDEFIKSYKYYLNRPDLTKVMFDSLSARGSRARDSLYKKSQNKPQNKPS